jgi:hypothetical protein
MKSTEIFIKSIKDTLSLNVIKSALLIGIPLAILWIVVASLFWSGTLHFTQFFIDWIPFSILKANGSFLFGGFIWFAVVLISYGILVSLSNVFILDRIKSKNYTHFAVLLLLFVSLFWSIFAFANWDFVYNGVMKILGWFPFKTLKDGVASMLAALIYYNLFIASLAIVVLMYRKSFLKHLQSDDYPNALMVKKDERVKFLSVALRDLGIFFALLILFFPLIFVPFVNILLQVVLWGWLTKESYFLAVASLYAKEGEYEHLKDHQVARWSIASVGALLNLVPLLNILAPFFTMILFFHWVMLNKKSV